MIYEGHMIAIAARHMYVYDKDTGIQNGTVNLKSVSQYVFRIKGKLYIGGPTLEIFSLNKWPFPRISTIKVQLNPIPKKVEVIDDFYFFSGEGLYSVSSFETLSLLTLNVSEKQIRYLNDFSPSTFGEDYF